MNNEIWKKLITIAENEPKVHKAGYKAGNILAETTSWDFMFHQGARNDLLPLLRYEDSSKVISMRQAFHSNHGVTEIPNIDTSNVTDFYYFCSFADNLTAMPDLDYSKATSMHSAFEHCKKLSSVPEVLDLRSAITLYNMFDSCENLRKIDTLLTDNCTNFNYMFYWCNCLNTIKSINISKAETATSMFYKCINLKEIHFEGAINVSLSFSDCTLLEHDTIMHIIDKLTDRTNLETKTLTLGSENLAKLTDAEKAIATEKGWTLT